jgi:anti-anti-sigma factor
VSTNRPGRIEFSLDIAVRTYAEAKIVKMAGDLRLGGPIDRFDETMGELVESGARRIVLDFEDVATIDSSGVGALVRALTVTKQNDIGIKLLNPTKLVVQTLKLVALLHLFDVYHDIDAAIASFEDHV